MTTRSFKLLSKLAPLVLLLAAALPVAYRLAKAHMGPGRLVVDDIKLVPIDGRGMREGYDTQVVIAAHHEGAVPARPGHKLAGGSWNITDVRLVHRHNGQQKAIPSPEGKTMVLPVSVAAGPKDSYFKVYLALNCVPAAFEAVRLEGRVYADYSFNIYKEGRAVSATHFPSRSTPFSVVVREAGS